MITFCVEGIIIVPAVKKIKSLLPRMLYSCFVFTFVMCSLSALKSMPFFPLACSNLLNPSPYPPISLFSNPFPIILPKRSFHDVNLVMFLSCGKSTQFHDLWLLSPFEYLFYLRDFLHCGFSLPRSRLETHISSLRCSNGAGMRLWLYQSEECL